ncbi:hypothetical protein [Gordonia sp. (in: high G+C Gram-positive bacteria)]|uniref:hypothetical protein n=1 Tax=Gordonia sp. (in: high G+C Gram-positive bacteria) TaxID=84139 RepID=UPI003C76FF55
MVLPLIPLVAVGVGVVTGSGGAVLGGRGAVEIKRANSRISAANQEYAIRRADSDERIDDANRRLGKLGSQQEQAFQDVVVRMRDFLVKNQHKVRDAERILLDGLTSASTNQLATTTGVDADLTSWARGIIGAATVGATTGSMTTSAVGALATASTGTSISSLSGAAASNATMAWLGGGSLASGGGGMAAGAVALNAVVAGPALLVTGLVIKGQGTKADTAATEVEAKVAIAIAELDAFDTELGVIEERSKELSDTLTSVTARAVDRLDVLESEDFEPTLHTERFQQAMAMTKAVAELAAVKVVDDDGAVSGVGQAVVLRYRSFVELPKQAESQEQVVVEDNS